MTRPEALRVPLPVAACVASLFCGAAAIAASPEPDLMNTAACRQARAQFDAAFDAARHRNTRTLATLDAARKDAALACLGASASSGASRAAGGLRAPQAPVVVPQAAAAQRMLPAVPAPPAAARPQPPLEIPRPSSITSCDPGGCWANDGSRINRVGAELVGPRGACNVQGVVVACP